MHLSEGKVIKMVIIRLIRLSLVPCLVKVKTTVNVTYSYFILSLSLSLSFSLALLFLVLTSESTLLPSPLVPVLQEHQRISSASENITSPCVFVLMTGDTQNAESW